MLIILRQSQRTFVDELAFVTSAGHANGGNWRAEAGLSGKGPTAIITDIGILRPHPKTRELMLTDLHPGHSIPEAEEATGWSLKHAHQCVETLPPSAAELIALRDLNERTAQAHRVG